MEAVKAGERKRMGRRPSTQESGREALLRHALTSFAIHGYDGTSLRSLASEAGVDAALVVRLFGSKRNLWQAIVDELAVGRAAHDEVIAALADRASQDPVQAVSQFIRLLTQISFEMPAFPAFLLQEAGTSGERREMLVSKLVEPFQRSCRPVIQAGMRAGIIPGSDTEIILGMLVSAISLPLAAPAVFTGTAKLDDALRDRLAHEAIAVFVRSYKQA